MDVLRDATVETLLTAPRAASSDPGGPERLPPVVRVINVPQLAADLLQREQRFVRAAFGYMRELVMVCDPQGNVILINHAMETFAGLDPTGVLPELATEAYKLSLPDGTLVGPDESPMAQALRGELVHDIEMVVTSATGQQCRMVANGERLSDPDGSVLGAIVVWRDITEQRTAEEQLAFHSLHDALTGLPNRALFIDRVRTALVRAPRYAWSTAVLAINLDHFADLAIRLGDGSADKLLLEVAQRLEVTLRPYDSVSRPVDTLARTRWRPLSAALRGHRGRGRGERRRESHRGDVARADPDRRRGRSPQRRHRNHDHTGSRTRPRDAHSRSRDGDASLEDSRIRTARTLRTGDARRAPRAFRR